ncbi:unnamed protein product [Rhizoctonia solani]|uniref:Uncharacterized protein n=1 Tax=Rhizoctonia solani TaxID=456999 RepID=A0A8H3HMV3_9AGAM|nr:unnamed protein product [Rhizoctonia solani]
MDYDANRINELLSQLQNSTAFQNVVTSNSNPTPSVPADDVTPPTPASIAPQPQTSGSTVFDLLSRLNPGASSSNQPPPPANESGEKPPPPIPEASPEHLRSMTVQQALPHIAKLTQRAEVREMVKLLQARQNKLEQSLSETQQVTMQKHEQRVAYAKNKANIVGVPLSEKEMQDLDSQLAEDLKKFHTNHVLLLWDYQRTKQQTQLESLGVPCMFETSDPAAVQRQQKVLRIIMDSLNESEDMD